MKRCVKCGKGGLFFKPVDGLYCITCASKRLNELQAEKMGLEKMMTPEMQEDQNLERLIEEKKAELEKTKVELKKTKDSVLESSRELRKKQEELLVVDSMLEFESFSLYKPKYACANSDQYKTRLDQLRENQKRRIKAKMAVELGTAWTINGSAREGKAFMADMSKLMLRSFNNECDAAIADVKFSNFDRCENRIEKTFEIINKLGKSVNVSISADYKKLKIDELILVHEYQLKKQEEKERLRELKEQQREEAKLLKEIEAARKETEKEKKHYVSALAKLREQLKSAKTDEEKQAILERINEMEQNIESADARLADIDYRQNNQRAGYVYIISNIGSFGEGIYKIGMTRRLDPYERVYELGDASVPFQFDTHAMIFSEDAPKLEAILHKEFADKRVNMVNTRREYFRVSLDEIKAVVHKNHDKTVEFIENPDAQQYRESKKMIK